VLPWCRERPHADRHVLARMIREIEILMSGDWFGCVLVISFNFSYVFAEIKQYEACYAIDCICEGACKSVASFARAFKSTGLNIRFNYASN